MKQKNTREKSMQLKVGNMDKVDKPLVRLTKKEKTQITKMNSESGDITTNLIELKGFIKE